MAAGILGVSIVGFIRLSGFLWATEADQSQRVAAAILAENIMEDLNTRLGSDNDLGSGTHVYYYDNNQIQTAPPGVYRASYRVRKASGYFTISLTVSWADLGPTHTVFLQSSRSQN